MPTGVPKRRHAARDRLDHREAEPLGLGGDEDGVGGVDPVRAPRPVRRRPIVSRRTSPAASRARSTRLSGRAGSWGKSRYGPSGSRPRRARASARGIGRKRSRSMPTGSTATRRDVPAPGHEAAELAGDGGRERRERQRRAGDAVRPRMEEVVAVQRHDDRAQPGGERGPGGEAEVRVDDVEARGGRDRTAGASRAPRAGSRAGRGRTRTARSRRRRAGAAPRPGRARTSPAPAARPRGTCWSRSGRARRRRAYGGAARARGAGSAFAARHLADPSHPRLEPQHRPPGDSLPGSATRGGSTTRGPGGRT